MPDYHGCPEYLCKCAAIIGEDISKLNWSMSSAVYCNKSATHATLCNPDQALEWKFASFNIGHFYCDEHANSAYSKAYPLPGDYLA